MSKHLSGSVVALNMSDVHFWGNSITSTELLVKIEVYKDHEVNRRLYSETPKSNLKVMTNVRKVSFMCLSWQNNENMSTSITGTFICLCFQTPNQFGIKLLYQFDIYTLMRKFQAVLKCCVQSHFVVL